MTDFEISYIPRLSSPSLAQLKAVVQFIQKHPNLAHKEHKRGVSYKKVQKLWMELSNVVNSIEGAVKSTKGWIKFWTDKQRNIMMKQKQISSGKLAGKLTSTEQKILDIVMTSKNQSLTQQQCNGDDNLYDSNIPDERDNELNLQVDTDRTPVTEVDERHLNIMEKMVEAMDQQTRALAKMAQAAEIKSKAMEGMAEASHKQALAVDRLAGTFEAIGTAALDVRNAVISIDYTLKKCFTTNTTQHRQNTLFS